MGSRNPKARLLGKAVLAVVAVAAIGGVVMLLWNAVLPALFDNANTIGYWHALGLLVLARILFGGFRGHGGHGGRGDRLRQWQWRKWQAMTPEEQENFQRRGPFGGLPRDRR